MKIIKEKKFNVIISEYWIPTNRFYNKKKFFNKACFKRKKRIIGKEKQEKNH
jgi:hypothetical protein